MKKTFSIILVLILTISLTGCEAIQRKFTRKRKKKAVTPRFFNEGISETRPKPELYAMHYVYWKTWQEDLINNLGLNRKRDLLACSEIMTNLKDMRKLLIEEKAVELDPYVKEMQAITDSITEGSMTTIREGLVKRRLDTLRARIVGQFYIKKIQEYIVAEEE